MKPPKNHDIPPHNKWGIYQLTCNTCNLSCLGQTKGNVKIRFQEYIRCISSNLPQSAFAQHILQNQHEYGQIISIMTSLKPLSSPGMLLPYEQYYIQIVHQEGNLIPEQYSGETNPLFQTAINTQPPNTK